MLWLVQGDEYGAGVMKGVSLWLLAWVWLGGVEHNEGTDVLGSIYLIEYDRKMIGGILDKIIAWCPFELSILPQELLKIHILGGYILTKMIFH